MTAPKATLKPYLAEIREWVSQGMTDVWIAHRLNSTPASISAFRSANGILRRDVAAEASGTSVPPPVIPPDAPEPAPETKPRRRSRGGRKRTGAGQATPASAPEVVESPKPEKGGGELGEPAEPKRRRRGGRGRGKRPQHTYEAVLDHGEEGYGFWLDGAVRDDTVFAQHWAARRGLVVKIEADQIVIKPDERA